MSGDAVVGNQRCMRVRGGAVDEAMVAKRRMADTEGSAWQRLYILSQIYSSQDSISGAPSVLASAMFGSRRKLSPSFTGNVEPADSSNSEEVVDRRKAPWLGFTIRMCCVHKIGLSEAGEEPSPWRLSTVNYPDSRRPHHWQTQFSRKGRDPIGIVRIAAPSHQRRPALGLLSARPRTVLTHRGHWHRLHRRLLRRTWEPVINELGLDVARTAANRQLAVPSHHHLGAHATPAGDAPVVVPVVSCAFALQVPVGQRDEKYKDHIAHDDADARLE
ncbi:uncharacterized protein PG986_000771 [Apiospora aurea]|uniref:Uncharacterized protein n=1 Tax=Apiospora aurea TaxID=335848 RepID=A0ABR1QV67_9PEZI